MSDPSKPVYARLIHQNDRFVDAMVNAPEARAQAAYYRARHPYRALAGETGGARAMSSRADKVRRLPVLGLARFGSRERCALATVDDIIAAVCRAHGITRSDLLSQRRYQHLFHARCVAAHLLRQHAGLNPGRIGMVLGMRDRTTIVHGLNRVSGDYARFAPLIARAQNLL